MPFGTFGDYFSAEGKMRKTHGNREKKRRIHDDRVKVNDRKNPSKSKEESRQFEKRKKVLFDFINDDLYVPMKI